MVIDFLLLILIIAHQANSTTEANKEWERMSPFNPGRMYPFQKETLSLHLLSASSPSTSRLRTLQICGGCFSQTPSDFMAHFVCLSNGVTHYWTLVLVLQANTIP